MTVQVKSNRNVLMFLVFDQPSKMAALFPNPPGFSVAPFDPRRPRAWAESVHACEPLPFVSDVPSPRAFSSPCAWQAVVCSRPCPFPRNLLRVRARMHGLAPHQPGACICTRAPSASHFRHAAAACILLTLCVASCDLSPTLAEGHPRSCGLSEFCNEQVMRSRVQPPPGMIPAPGRVCVLSSPAQPQQLQHAHADAGEWEGAMKKCLRCWQIRRQRQPWKIRRPRQL